MELSSYSNLPLTSHHRHSEVHQRGFSWADSKAKDLSETRPRELCFILYHTLLQVIRAAPDMAEQHIATMNCLFAAQKQVKKILFNLV